MGDIITFDNALVASEFERMEKAIAESTEDGIVYNGLYMTVERRDGTIFMCGKPPRIPMRIKSSGV